MQLLFVLFHMFPLIFLCSHKKPAIFSAIFITVFCHILSLCQLQYSIYRYRIPKEIVKMKNYLSICHTTKRPIVIIVKGDDPDAGLARHSRCSSLCALILRHDPARMLYVFARPSGRAGCVPEYIPQAAATRSKI